MASKPRTDGVYLTFEVVGDSMDDGSDRAIKEKDVVIARELYQSHWTNKLHLPKVFVLVFKHNGILIKEVISHDVQNGVIVCKSRNNNYEDITVKMTDLVKMYYLKEVRREII